MTFIILDETGIAVARCRTWLWVIRGRVCPHLHAFAFGAEELAAVLWRTAVLLGIGQSVMGKIETFAISPDPAVLTIIKPFKGSTVTELIRLFRRVVGGRRTTRGEES